MHLSGPLAVLLAGAASLTAAAPAQHEPWAACENTATARRCWGPYSIDTDMLYEWPNTEVVRKYNFNVAYRTMAPDGVLKKMIVVNGQYPGPTIEANWGDDIEVNVCNNLPDNGTSIHFHGVRQLNTNHADGVPGQTQCPIAPGDCHTYRWKATQHGTSWYRSAYSLQYGDGLLGPIVIKGPNTADWDVDLGPLLLSDHYHESVFELAQKVGASKLGVPPTAINGLLNGKNAYRSGGARHNLFFTPGRKHLIRLVNTASQATFRFGIDKHRMTVVAMDFVPVQPYTTNTLLLAVGQRYDVIVEADQPGDDYWARAKPMLSCFAVNLQAGDIRAIVRYDQTSTADPGLLSSTSHLMLDVCRDEDLDNLKPWHARRVGPSVVQSQYRADLLPFANDSYALRWQVGDKRPYSPSNANPAALQVLDSNADLPADMIPMDLTGFTGRNWVWIVVENFLPVSHPLQLHGHDVAVVARGQGLYLPKLADVQTANPPRRDTVNLPANGYVVLAFETDNAGAWLLQCNILWHLHGGFGMTILEGSRQGIKDTYRRTGEDVEMRRVCANWASRVGG